MSVLIVNGATGESACSRTDAVMRDTWGHMDANPGTRYRGHVVFAAGCFGGDRVILESEFGNAGYGPWFYKGVQEWVYNQEAQEGYVYRFDGLLPPRRRRGARLRRQDPRAENRRPGCRLRRHADVRVMTISLAH